VWNRDGTQKLTSGTLAVLDNQINQTTATLRLKALVKNTDRTLWVNEFVKARILIENRKDATVIPTVAVQHGPQGAFVYAVGSDGTAQLRPVTVALTTDDQAVIDKGLTSGEEIVVEGQNQLRPGTKVAPVKPGQGGKPDGPPSKAGAGAGSGARPGRGSAAGPTAKAEEPAPP
jgi:multidrug efflux system membrane fusion protein